jgi:RNA polymerase sigma-70 factor, ECF subfamily
METEDQALLQAAVAGDIHAFQALFARFQPQLRSYLYRLTANRNDAEDFTHDTFIRAFDRLADFRGESSLKTWVFRIATHLAYNQLQRQKRWTADVSAQAKRLVMENPALAAHISEVAASGSDTRYEIKEHIDTCFTCIGKTLPVENQVALLLKEVYDFSVKEICLILDRSEGVVKYLIQDARRTMTDVFDQRCALVNQNGVCHQCSELNAWFNPKQEQQAAKMALDLVKGSQKYDREALFDLRAGLVKAIDPLLSGGAALQNLLLDCNRMAMGELPLPS